MALQAIMNVNVDFYDKGCILINAKQLDRNARCLLVTCYSKGTLFPLNIDEHSVYVRYKKPDGNAVFNSCSITDDGKVLVTLTEQMLAYGGICHVDLLIVEKSQATIINGKLNINSNTSILSTMTFYIDVSDSIVDNAEIESSYEYNALHQELLKVNALVAGLTTGSDGSSTVQFIHQGSVTLNELKQVAKVTGFVYNIKEDFTTDATFAEGSGIPYGAGTNVYFNADGKWDCLSGTSVFGIKGDKESAYRKGKVNLTAQNIGAISSDDIATISEVKGYLRIT